MTTELDKAETPGDLFEMSDEDFMNAAPPASAASKEEEAPVVSDEQPKVEEPAEGAGASAEEAAATEGDGKTAEQEEEASKPTTTPDGGDKAGQAAGDGATPEGASPEGEGDTQPPDYEGFFKKVMASFKANGKTFEPKTPDEAIRLMQMGAGYGRKIQELQPHLKVLRMLEKNNLLDEGRLSFLIDINEKNPDAIKKIVKDSGLDPLDLNVDEAAPYVPKNRSVSDKEMALQEALSTVSAHDNGPETIKVINQTWDQESKSLLWESPEILSIIQTQRETGIYDQVVAEIDRQKLLGKIPHSTPFLKAYDIAGKHLDATGAFKSSGAQVQQIQHQPANTPQPQVIASRAAASKPQVQNGDKAAAAAGTRASTAGKAASTVNPLSLPDDEFMKTFKGRF